MPDSNVREYYFSKKLAQIMNMLEEQMIRQLQFGRYKEAFIDRIGQ
ncbi:hypothetical protein [Paenibacillus amylolyticus]|nr:hypothetical protein [Paenibacillus amylolyticus]